MSTVPKYEEKNKLWREKGLEAYKAGKNCPVCRGLGKIPNDWLPPGWRTCQCYCAIKRCLEEQISRLGIRYEGINLTALQPSGASKLKPEFQAKEIKFLQSNQDKSFVFFGPTGASKSWFSTALYSRHLLLEIISHTRKCCRVKTDELLDRYHEWSTSNNKSEIDRIVTPEDIYRASRRIPWGYNKETHGPAGYIYPKFVLHLEEIDKRKMTDFVAKNLFDLFDALYEDKGILLMTSNLTPQGFKDWFLESDNELIRSKGAPLLRRIFEGDDIIVRDYWDKCK